MSQPDIIQSDRIQDIRKLAKSHDLRIAATDRHCFFYASDKGLKDLKDIGVDVTPPAPSHVDYLKRDFDLGETRHPINPESIRTATGGVALDYLFRDVASYIPKNPPGVYLHGPGY